MAAIQWVAISVSNNFFICQRILPLSWKLTCWGFNFSCNVSGNAISGSLSFSNFIRKQCCLRHSVVVLESGLGLESGLEGMTRTWTHRTWTRYQRTRTWTWHLWTWEFRSSPVRVHHLNFLVDIYSLLRTKLPPGVETAQIAPSVRVSSLIFQRSFSRQEYIPNGNPTWFVFATKFDATCNNSLTKWERWRSYDLYLTTFQLY
jgi:hypothetical protein